MQIANKILDFLVELRELGYPSHLTDVARNGLKCNEKEADLIVSHFILPDVTLILPMVRRGFTN